MLKQEKNFKKLVEQDERLKDEIGYVFYSPVAVFSSSILNRPQAPNNACVTHKLALVWLFPFVDSSIMVIACA